MNDIKQDAQKLFERYTFLQLKAFSVSGEKFSEYEEKVMKLALDLHRDNFRKKLNETK
jgi:hypothetical protein